MGAAHAAVRARVPARRRWQPRRVHVRIATLSPLLVGVIVAAALFWVGHLGVKDAIHQSNALADAEAALVAAVAAGDPDAIDAALELAVDAEPPRPLEDTAALARDPRIDPDASVTAIRDQFAAARLEIQAANERRFLWLSGIGLAAASAGGAASVFLWRRRWNARWQRVRALRNAVTEMTDAPLDSAFEPSGADDDIGVVEVAVARLTRDLADRLVHQQRLSLLGQQVAFVAHDIRNPLGTITMGLSLLKPTKADQELHALLQDELRRATAMLEEFRGFARADDEPRPVALEHEVAAAVRAAAHRALDAGVKVEADLRPAGIFGRPNEIRQVLANLLENAIDAAAGSPRKLVYVTTLSSDGVARISVEDSGPGVHPSARSKIFRSFYTTKETGSGMGLAICRRIVEGAGGSIEVDASTELGGARFTVTLPVQTDCRPQVEPGPEPAGYPRGLPNTSRLR